ncbi:MAG: hypothetical protein ABI224_18210 [Acetobacteraceae bacterium]
MIDTFRNELARKGYASKAILPDAEFARLVAAADADPAIIRTPPDELRYIEGLLELPLGHLKFFCVVPQTGDGVCACGRRMSALDIVSYAVRHAVHSRSLIRDTLIGLRNMFEIAQGGRQGECLNCGRPVVSRVYYSHTYMYA